MAYLIEQDYLPNIQVGNKAAMIQGSAATQARAEARAQAEAISYLRQKYDTSAEFTDTAVWVRSIAYKAANRVYLNAAAWVASHSYVLHDLVVIGGNVYQCATANSDATFTESNWTNLGPQYTIFYAKFPYPVFNLAGGAYSIGDIVFWKDKTYTCKVATAIISHESALQYAQYQNIPYSNVFPDDPVNGVNYWTAGSTYTVPANTEISNTTYWTQGDNRDQQMVATLVIMTIYHLSLNISTQNLPKGYLEAYKGTEVQQVHVNGFGTQYPTASALGFLQACARGEVTPALPLLQPPTGKRIRFGGPVKNINSY